MSVSSSAVLGQLSVDVSCRTHGDTTLTQHCLVVQHCVSTRACSHKEASSFTPWGVSLQALLCWKDEIIAWQTTRGMQWALTWRLLKWSRRGEHLKHSLLVQACEIKDLPLFHGALSALGGSLSCRTSFWNVFKQVKTRISVKETKLSWKI